MDKSSRSPIKQISEMTVNELEGVSPLGPFPSSLTERIADVRKIPIGELDPSEARLLLSQHQGTTYVVPKALEFLEGDPWIQATFYPGDLLKAVLKLERVHWPPGSEWSRRIRAVVEAARTRVYELPVADRNAEVLALVNSWSQRFPD